MNASGTSYLGDSISQLFSLLQMENLKIRGNDHKLGRKIREQGVEEKKTTTTHTYSKEKKYNSSPGKEKHE